LEFEKINEFIEKIKLISINILILKFGIKL